MDSVSSSSKTSGPVYEIRDVDKKGKGMIATQAIMSGDIILQEVPAIVVDATNEPLEDSIIEGYHRLDIATRIRYNALTSLADHAEPTEAMKSRLRITRLDEEASRIVGIFYSNEMMEAERKWRYLAIEASRINHSCVPNATYIFLSKNRMVIRALSSISKGMEVSVTYVNPMAPKEERKEDLWNGWRFVCTCQACNTTPLFSDGTSNELARVVDKVYHSNKDTKKGNPDESILHQQIQYCNFFVEHVKGIEALMPSLAPILEIYVRLLSKAGWFDKPVSRYGYRELHRILTILRGPDHASVIACARAIEKSKAMEKSHAGEKSKAVGMSRGCPEFKSSVHACCSITPSSLLWRCAGLASCILLGACVYVLLA